MQNCKRKKLQSVQALRGLAFLAVFTGHAGLSNAQWSAVSLFFVLSGFLMVYNYLPDFREQDKPSFWKNIRFSYKKIQNLYMLHVVTTLLVLPITIVKTFGGGQQ